MRLVSLRRAGGCVRFDQLRAAGVSESTARRWRDAGYLFAELPRVYAVGHPGRSPESDLAAALLYAGPGAALAAGTALHWRGLLKHPPHEVIIATPRRVRDLHHVRILHLARTWRQLTESPQAIASEIVSYL